MKQQILNLKKKLLIVELDGNSSINDSVIQSITEHGLMKEVGKLTDITEQQFAEWVDNNDEYGVVMFKNYTTKSAPYYDEQLTAKESFFSYLEANGVCFENKLGKQPYVSIFDIYPDSPANILRTDWQEAEQKVWNREQTCLFQIL